MHRALSIAAALWLPACTDALHPFGFSEDATLWFGIGIEPATGMRAQVLSPEPISFPYRTEREPEQVGLIGISGPFLASVRPFVSPGVAESARLVEEDQSACLDGVLSSNGRRLLQPLFETESIQTWVGSVDGLKPGSTDLLSGLSLDLPVGAQPCVVIDPPVPFGDKVELLPDTETICGQNWAGHTEDGNVRLLRSSLQVSSDRWIARSNRVIYDFRRGEGFVDTPPRRLCFDEAARAIGGEGLQFREMLFEPGRTDRIFVAAYLDAGGAILELAVSDAGISVVGSSTISPEQLNGIDIDPATGETFASGRAGFGVVGASPRGPFHRVLVSAFDANVARVTPDPTRRWISAGDVESVSIGDATTGLFRTQHLGDHVDRPIRSIDTHMVGSLAEVWAVSAGSLTPFRLPPDSEAWQALRIGTERVSSVCAQDLACGRAYGVPEARSIVRSGNLVLTLAECGVLMAYDVERTCADAIDVEIALGRLLGIITDAATEDDRVRLVGESGTVLEVQVHGGG